MLLAALLLTAGAPATPDVQIFIGPAFADFARRTDRMCPTRKLRNLTPGDLDWLQDGFIERLSKTARAGLTAANAAGQRRCADRNGLSCAASETMRALARRRLIPAFARFACGQDLPG